MFFYSILYNILLFHIHNIMFLAVNDSIFTETLREEVLHISSTEC